MAVYHVKLDMRCRGGLAKSCRVCSVTRVPDEQTFCVIDRHFIMLEKKVNGFEHNGVTY